MKYNECHPFCFKITIFTEFSDLKITCVSMNVFLLLMKFQSFCPKIFSNLIHAFHLQLFPFKFCTLSSEQNACLVSTKDQHFHLNSSWSKGQHSAFHTNCPNQKIHGNQFSAPNPKIGLHNYEGTSESCQNLDMTPSQIVWKQINESAMDTHKMVLIWKFVRVFAQLFLYWPKTMSIIDKMSGQPAL